MDEWKLKWHGKRIWGLSFLQTCGDIILSLRYGHTEVRSEAVYPHKCPTNIFWACTSLNNGDGQIFDVFYQIRSETPASDCQTIIFGIPPQAAKVSNLQANALAFASLPARGLILF